MPEPPVPEPPMPEPPTTEPLVAALVILAGAPSDPTTAVARNAGALQAAPDAVARARRAFEAFGFRSQPGAGHAFSIEAVAHRFEATFGVRLDLGKDGGVRVVAAGARDPLALPLDALPPSLRAQLDAVVFSVPPAFGPGHLP